MRGDELDELVVVVADVAARVGGREEDVVALIDIDIERRRIDLRQN